MAGVYDLQQSKYIFRSKPFPGFKLPVYVTSYFTVQVVNLLIYALSKLNILIQIL